MNSTDFYPHLSAKWVNDVTLGLRSRGASGASIGDALAVAEAHCADSGETPDSSFGDPLEYAASVSLPDTEESRPLVSQLRDGWPSLLGLVGMFVAFACVDDWNQSGGIGIRAGVTLAIAVIMIGSTLLVIKPDVTLARPYIGGVLLAIVFVVVVILQTVLRQPLFHLPQMVAVGLSVAFLAGSVVAGYRQDIGTDTVIDPMRGNPWPRSTKILAVVTPWLFVVMTLIAVIIFSLIPS